MKESEHMSFAARYFKTGLIAAGLCAAGSVPLLRADFIYDSSVAVFTSQQTPANGDTGSGFAWFKAGFVLPGSSGSFTARLIPPVGGVISMNAAGSTLVLDADMHLASGASITNSGSINGGGYAVHLADNLAYTGTSKTLTVSGDLILDGHNHVFSLSGSNSITIASAKTLTLRNMTLLLDTSATPFSLSSDSTLVLDNVRVVLTTNYALSAGLVTIKGKTSLSGMPGSIFTYSSAGDFTISASSELHIDRGITLKHNHATDGDIVFTDRTSRLRLEGGTLESAARALTLQTGTLITDDYSYLKSSGGSGSITIGDSTNRLYVILAPAASFDVSGNSVTYANSN